MVALRTVGKGLLGLAAAWGLVALVAWLGGPPLLKWQGQKQLSQALGREVRIDEVALNPWRLALRVSGLTVAGAADQPLLHVARLAVDVSARSLVERAPVIESLEVDGLAVNVARTGDGRYDVDDLIARFTPAASADPAGDPSRFALFNLQLRGASLRFDDQPAGRVHRLDGVKLSLPFLSNLPTQMEVKVEPRLAFKFNGTPFDTGAQATPFAQTRRAELRLTMGALDLLPYRPYLPAGLPLKLSQGRAHADLTLNFEQAPAQTPQLSLKGQVGFDQVALTDADAQPMVSWDTLSVSLRDAQPLARRVALEAVRWTGATVHLRRDTAGRIDWATLAEGGTERASGAAPAPAPASSTASAPRQASPPARNEDWQLSLNALAITQSAVVWRDAAVQPAVALQLGDLTLNAQGLSWPASPDGSATLGGVLQRAAAAPGDPMLGRVSVTAQGTPEAAQLHWDVSRLALQALAPYWAGSLVPALSGELATVGNLAWGAQGIARGPDRPAAAGQAGTADAASTASVSTSTAAPQLRVTLDRLTLDRLRLDPPAPPARPVHAAVATRGGPAVDRKAAGTQSTSADATRTEARTGAARGSTGTALTPRAADPTALATLRQLSVQDARIDLLGRTVSIGRLLLNQPSLHLERHAQGRWNVQDWLVGPPAVGAVSASANAAAAGPGPAPNDPPAWRLRVATTQLQGGELRVTDAQPTDGGGADEPLRWQVGGLQLGAQGLAWPAAPGAAPLRLQLAARVGAQASPQDPTPHSGSVNWSGTLGLAPWVAQGKVRIDRFPVALFEPYAGRALPLALVRAEAGIDGELTAEQSTTAGWRVAALADVNLGDIELHARRPDGGVGDELLSWQRLTLAGTRVDIEPGRQPAVAVREATLSDFYSRLVITEQGRFNLQDVAGAPTSAEAPAAGATATATPAAVTAAKAGSAATATATATAADGGKLPIRLSLGATRLVNGRIDFTDRFVKPNYSAALSELNGQLGAFRSDTRDMATLTLRGRAAGTALLDISGQLNPTAEPLALDIRARATDLELAPLSPYAGKYAGYAIERGKLSMDIAYKIEPDGRLDARNQVVLNQLTFGDRIESPQATRLPVLLAVALLKDRNGVIDINLPVSGSLNDPQFSVGGIVLKVIVNLLTKALTAPFALLSGGGTDDLSTVEFRPGTATLAASGEAALDKVARALAERPALKMTVTGSADPAAEGEAYQREALEARLLAEHRRERLRSAATAGALATAPASTPAAASAAPAASTAGAPPAALAAGERERLLRLVYRQTDLPAKPKNLVGLTKDIPLADMEALLRRHARVSSDAMRELALQRGLAVRDALIARGLPGERLFLAAPRLRAAGDDAASDSAWTPRVQLSLSSQ